MPGDAAERPRVNDRLSPAVRCISVKIHSLDALTHHPSLDFNATAAMLKPSSRA
jgi:hypothetical protein